MRVATKLGGMAAYLVGIGACAPGQAPARAVELPPPPAERPPAPEGPRAAEASPEPAPATREGGDAGGAVETKRERPPFAGCRLPAPVVSDDACVIDADCGVSEPCHARACVAKAKSRPPGPDTVCTRELVCTSADVNRCGCLEGRCALIPPS